MKSLARSFMASIVMELVRHMWKPFYAKWGIVFIHYRNITLFSLGYEANHLRRTMVTYLLAIGRDTP